MDNRAYVNIKQTHNDTHTEWAFFYFAHSVQSVCILDAMLKNWKSEKWTVAFGIIEKV